ncbi:zinc-binding alcohol dehydrogenase family protein [Actinoplanes sp. M2I2]|uniref:zinc-binding alcohol dehydrogenase family protein n=1 Tax=Actinoplanes sp. M2I2 TaxID=1734444 RepID=UPI0020225F02|nr:zinc-binding alcohol dehydrogenase family protein [Actinoplanes sp. M2I2]
MSETSRLPDHMTVIGSYQGLPITDTRSLVEAELPLPELRPHDILVHVLAVSVNPADVKRRAGAPTAETLTVLGFDAAGTVVAVGPEATGYAVGDEVYYAGDVSRPGSNAEYHAVDSRIVGRKPVSLSWAQAAAVPLTTITAWEALFDKFKLTSDSTGTLLVVAGAGGVGSMLIQLAKRLTKLTVIATASREESRDWAYSLGADAVVDHSGDLATNVLDEVPDGVDYIFSPYSKGNVENYAKVAKTFGEVCAIDGHPDLNLQPLMQKSISWHWEWMFTRSVFQTADITDQRDLLDRASQMFDAGDLRTTLTTELVGFTAENLREAHQLVESGRTIGKVVVVRP